jgi:hypothetical protein
MTDRRAFLAGLALAPVVVATPAVAQTFTCSFDPVDRYRAAVDAVNNDRITEEEHLQAVDDLDFWEPPTQRDFIRKFIAQFEDGSVPNDERLEILLGQARRLIG